LVNRSATSPAHGLCAGIVLAVPFRFNTSRCNSKNPAGPGGSDTQTPRVTVE
jgi:hypothetical protein